MISKARRTYSGATGRVAEVRFLRSAEGLGLRVMKSSKEEDIFQHVDYWLSMNNKGRWGVDVKGNNLPDEIWCEMNNVQGKPGWLYGGAKIIAFDMPEEGGFSVVNREELKIFCEEEVEDTIVQDKRSSYRKKYQRRDRKDIITKLMLQDLKLLESYRVWKYFNDY